MELWIISGILGFVAGGAFIWFAKTKIQSMVIDANTDRKSTRLNSSHIQKSRMPSSA